MSNCTIYNKSFLDDIVDIKTFIDNSTVNIDWLTSKIRDTISEDNIWTPLIIGREDSLIAQKLLSDHGSMLNYGGFSNLLGVQNFITNGAPSFNFWNVTNGTMSTDWVLNNSYSSHDVSFGLLCWFKKLNRNTSLKPISDFPNNSRITLSNSNRAFIKIDNNILYEITSNKNSSRFTDSGDINFSYNENNDNNNFVNIDSLGNNPRFITTYFFQKENRGNNTTDATNTRYSNIIIDNNEYLLWIPNGDVYSYYINRDERNYQQGPGIAKTFCSSSLYQTYNAIYYQLTKFDTKNLSYRIVGDARRSKLLAKYLSTSPYIDDNSINSISQWIENRRTGSPSGYSLVSKQDVQQALTDISKHLNQEFINARTSTGEESFVWNFGAGVEIPERKNLNNNIVYDLYSLKEKLIQKYGSKLSLSPSSSISTKQNLTYGSDVIIGQIGEYWLGQSLENTTIFSNQTISIGDLTLETNFQDKKSHILLKRKSLPNESRIIKTYDAVKPKIKNSDINKINVVLEKTTNNPDLPEYNDVSLFNRTENIIFYYQTTSFIKDLIKFKVLMSDTLDIEEYRAASDPFSPSDIIAQNYINCVWTQVSGPPLKFIDINKYSGSSINIENPFVIRSPLSEGGIEIGEDRVFGLEAVIIPSLTGRYQIKCEIFTPFGNFVKIKTFYVVNGETSIVRNDISRDSNFGKMIAPYKRYGISNIDNNNIQPNIIPHNGFGRPNFWMSFTGNNPLVEPDLVDVNYIKEREKTPISLNSDNLRAHIPHLKKIALNSNGLFWPVNTNITVKGTRSRPEQLNNDLFKFQFPQPQTKPPNSPAILNIIYNLHGSLSFKLDRIILENTRNNKINDCQNCSSFYYPQLYSSNGRYSRAEGRFILEGWDVDGDNNVIQTGQETYALPQISTNNSPSIKPYGGYDTRTINSIGTIFPDHPSPGEIFPAITGRPLDYKSDNPSSDSPYYDGDGRKFCFENVLPQSNQYITFEKGVFDPSVGWIQYDSPLYESTKNLSNVLKFNPGARESFNFRGPSIHNITNDSYILAAGWVRIIPKEFRSEIDLRISTGAQWIQYGKKCSETQSTNPDGTPKESLTAPPDWSWRNQLHREYVDQALNLGNFGETGHYYNHGYRILEGGAPKREENNSSSLKDPVLDEFGFSSNKINNSFIYRFPTFGYFTSSSIPPEVVEYWNQAQQQLFENNQNEGPTPDSSSLTNLEAPSWDGLKKVTVPNFTIQDVEVKLNFLNYVNLQDMTIVFESTPCSTEAQRIDTSFTGCDGPVRYNSPINGSEKRFIDQTIENFIDTDNSNQINIYNNQSVKRFLRMLTHMNSYSTLLPGPRNDNSSRPAGPLKLFLLNQEYIQNHNFNLNLIFSDNAPKNNTLSNISSVRRNNLFNISSDERYSGDINPESFSTINNSFGLNADLYNLNRTVRFLEQQSFVDGIKPKKLVSDIDKIGPSMSPIGFSDYQNQILSNIVKVNKLNIIHNTFSKYKNKPLFLNSIPCCRESDETTEAPLHNGQTKFACVITLYDEHDDMSSNDNIVDAQLYTNIYDFDNKLNTNQFTHSLCGWELFLHVGKTNKEHGLISSSLHSYESNNNILSLIDYGKKPKYPGYSFIANLKNHKHLLPFINLNAPYLFAQGSSICDTSDTRNIGRAIKSQELEFPSLAIIQILGAMAEGAGLAAAGGLVGVGPGIALSNAGSAAAYAAIVGFFNNARSQRFTQGVANDAYHQDYTSYPQGSPEKILVNFSKDNVFWYKAEASIFKYKNTPVLPLNTYNYIRLNSTSFPLLSRFEYSIVKDIKELIDNKYIQELNLDSLNFPNYQQEPDILLTDLVDINFGNRPENTPEPRDGLYMRNISTNSEGNVFRNWIYVEDYPLVLNECFRYILENHIIYNNVSIFANFNQNKNDNKIIILEGSIPYEIFDINDTIVVGGENTEDSSTVLSKALIYKDNKPYSVLCIDRDMSSPINYISPNNNVIVLFKLNSSSDFNNSCLNMHSFEKESLNSSLPPEILKSTNSLGSYGNGSIQTNTRYILPSMSYSNLKKLYNIFNNHENDKIKYNKMCFGIEENFDSPLLDVGPSIGYPHRLEDISLYIDNFTTFTVDSANREPSPSSLNANETLVRNTKNIEDALLQAQKYTFNNIQNNYHLVYIKNNNFRPSVNANIPSDFGYIKVEEDYNNTVAIQPVDIDNNIISDTLFNDLVAKLNTLENLAQISDLDPLVGILANTNRIISSNNLNYILQHYDSLTEYNVQKQRTEFALKVLYRERDDILKLLNQISLYQIANITMQDDTIINGRILVENIDKIVIENHSSIDKNNVKNITRSFIRNTNLNKIRGQQKAIISQINPFTWVGSSVYDIVYEDNNDDYWINLDPNQSCSIAEELRPKVLTSISYLCRPANYQQTIFGTPLLAENNICARKRGSSLQDGVSDLDGVRFTTDTRRIRGEPYEAYTYSFSDQEIGEKKSTEEAKLIGITPKWIEKKVIRNYHINGTNDNDPVYSNSEILIQVEETYQILLAPHELTDGKISTSIDGDTSNFGGPDWFVPETSGPKIPGLAEGFTFKRIPRDSPPGFGLLLGATDGLLTDPRSNQTTKIYNICNLDEVNRLSIKFRKIPRQVRGIDLLATVYRYGVTSPYLPGPRITSGDPLDPVEISNLRSATGFALNNNMYYWRCMEIDNASNSLIESSTPLFFQLMNEMMYRNFYGSSDNIENKYNALVSQFLWELIPYEYF